MKNVELIASYWTLSGGAIPHTGPEASTGVQGRGPVACRHRAHAEALQLRGNEEDPRCERHEVHRDRVPRGLVPGPGRAPCGRRGTQEAALRGERAARRPAHQGGGFLQDPVPDADAHRRVRRALPGGRPTRHPHRLRAHAVLGDRIARPGAPAPRRRRAEKRRHHLRPLAHREARHPVRGGHEVPEGILHRP
jgi:hypothetical protein